MDPLTRIQTPTYLPLTAEQLLDEAFKQAAREGKTILFRDKLKISTFSAICTRDNLLLVRNAN